MGRIKSLNKWANAHTYYPLDLVRIFLGAFLFYKGIDFMGNTGILMDLLKPINSMVDGMVLVHYVAPAHFVGGILIVFGLLTRWAIVAQLPILVVAILINFLGVMNTSNLLVAIAILVLCIFFLIYGSGKHSVDKYLKMEK
jgi:uncharacterized membrane protein YphA (DoxX/SURF4 family)